VARKTLTYTVSDEGRDQGKQFLITEMAASKGESWAVDALSAIFQGDPTIPPDFIGSGMAGIARLGADMIFKAPAVLIKPLLAELMGCVKCMPDPSNPQVTRPLVESDIEEIKTRFLLMKEVFALHIGFFAGGVTSTSATSSPAAKVTP